MLALTWFEYKFNDSSLLPWKEKVTGSIFLQHLSSLKILFVKKGKKDKKEMEKKEEKIERKTRY